MVCLSCYFGLVYLYFGWFEFSCLILFSIGFGYLLVCLLMFVSLSLLFAVFVFDLSLV